MADALWWGLGIIDFILLVYVMYLATGALFEAGKKREIRIKNAENTRDQADNQ